MSWLARSFVNSLKVEDDSEDDEEQEHQEIKSRTRESEKNIDGDHEMESTTEEEVSGRGVKEDLSELTKTLTRQLWGVASFLAPPPSEPSSPSNPPHRNSSSDPSTSDSNPWDSSDHGVGDEVSESGRIAGIRSDFAEIGGRFKTRISKLSNHKAVSEISKIASSFLPFGSDENSDENYLIGDVVGVTDEVVVFARNIAMHPETWLDFPLADLDDSDDFDMSDAQQEHALAVERLAPALAALRIELCPGHMSEGCFWKIYFVLLHSRLNKHDAELLSTPQIVEARAMLMHELPGQAKREPDHSGIDTNTAKESAGPPQESHPSILFNVPDENTELKIFGVEPKSSMETTDTETDEHPIVSREIQIKSPVETAEIETESRQVDVIDKVVVEEPMVVNEKKDFLSSNSKRLLHQTDEEDADDWLAESTDMDDFAGTSIPIGNEEDVSFSDLEEDEDDDGKVMSSPQTVTHCSDSSSGKDPRDWVQLGKSSDDSSDDGKASSRRADKPESKVTGDWLNVNEQHCESPM